MGFSLRRSINANLAGATRQIQQTGRDLNQVTLNVGNEANRAGDALNALFGSGAPPNAQNDPSAPPEPPDRGQVNVATLTAQNENNRRLRASRTLLTSGQGIGDSLDGGSYSASSTLLGV